MRASAVDEGLRKAGLVSIYTEQHALPSTTQD